jgi:cytochrome b involved in lipid metabolism
MNNKLINTVFRQSGHLKGWISLNGGIYDVSKFLTQHPGGGNKLHKYFGKDISNVFYHIHMDFMLNSAIDAKLVTKIGTLEDNKNNNSTIDKNIT